MFEYIAVYNTDAAAALCADYGIEVNPNDTVSVENGLMMIVDEHGEQGVKAVLALHPDKGIIMENMAPAPAGSLLASPCSNCSILQKMLIRTNQADGGTSAQAAQSLPQNNNHLSAVLQTNTLIVVGILAFVTTAILLHAKKSQ